MDGSELRRLMGERVAAVEARMARACARAGRARTGVRLVAASKLQPPEAIRAAAEAGVRCFGENRVQEGAAKRPVLAGLEVEWRLIGRLQGNKAARALECFDAIDSVDSLDLARRLDRLATARGRRVPCLLEINIGGEPQKGGFTPAQAPEAAAAVAALAGLDWRGVMAVPPAADRAEASRGYFRALASLAGRLREASGRSAEGWEISMGMSHDFEVAIEEGATMVRIGTALFGERPPAR